MEEAAEKLSKLKVLQEKRKLEHPSPAGGGLAGVMSTPGEAVNISSSSEASTSAIEMTERESGRGVTNLMFGTNPNNY